MIAYVLFVIVWTGFGWWAVYKNITINDQLKLMNERLDEFIKEHGLEMPEESE